MVTQLTFLVVCREPPGWSELKGAVVGNRKVIVLIFSLSWIFCLG